MLKRLLSALLLLSLAVPGSFLPGTAQTQPDTRTVASLEVLTSDTGGITFEAVAPVFYSAETQIEGETFQTLVAPGTSSKSVPGSPQIPMLSAVIGIPPDAVPRIAVLLDEMETIAAPGQLLPSPQPQRIVDDLTAGEWTYLPHASTQPAGAIYPQATWKIEDAWLRDQRILRLEVYPVQYDPSNQSLSWHKRLQVRVEYDSQQAVAIPQLEPASASPFDSVLKGLLVNYEEARAWRAQTLPTIFSGDTLQASAQVEGPRYKIVVDQDGIYRLTYVDLQAAGMDVNNIDPRTFHLTNQGDDVAIFVNGESNGSFDPGEYITFYGQYFRGDRMAQRYTGEASQYLTFSQELSNGDLVAWSPQLNAEMLEKYTRENVYWLQVSGVAGPRMATQSGTPVTPGYTIPLTYTTTVHAEKINAWYTHNFSSEDTRYWERIQNTVEHTYTTTLTALATTPFFATLRGEVAARLSDENHNPDHHTKIWLNSGVTPVDDAFWIGLSRYHFEQQVPHTALLEGVNSLRFKVEFDAYAGQDKDDIYFDWFELDYPRRFVAASNQIFFERNGGGDLLRYQVSNFTSPGVEVYNVTDALLPKRVLTPGYASGTATFQSQQSGQVAYFVAGTTAVKSPKSISFYDPPDIRSASNSVDYLIITHANLISGAQVLANHRQAQGLQTMVVDVADLYNEFNDGIYHSIAIKNFLAYTLANWIKAPEYVVLIGDGHWNFFGSTDYLEPPLLLPPHLAWVDPWQGEVDSSNLLASVVGIDVLPDFFISRIPVVSLAELDTVVDKIFAYEASAESSWQRRMLFISDRPDGAGDFEAFSNNFIADYVIPGYNASKIYVDDICGSLGSAQCKALVTPQIINQLANPGAVLTNYVGHGSIRNWSGDAILHTNDIPNLTNTDRPTVVVSLTCLDGYWTHPGTFAGGVGTPSESLMETMLRAPNGGAVAAFSPTGLGVATGHDSIQRGFYDSFFTDGNWELGAASYSARARLYLTGVNYDLIQTFTLFGDPAMKVLDAYDTPGISPASAAESAEQGAQASYSFQVQNTSLITDTYSIDISGDAWTASAPASVGPVAPGASQNFNVNVTVPLSATDGQFDLATVSLVSQGDQSETISAAITTYAGQLYALTLDPAGINKFGNPGGQVQYTVEVTNTGYLADAFSVSTIGVNWPTVVVPTRVPSAGSLSPGQKGQFTVTVLVPASNPGRTRDLVILIVTSLAHPSTWKQSFITTILTGEDSLFLPGMFH